MAISYLAFSAPRLCSKSPLQWCMHAHYLLIRILIDRLNSYSNLWIFWYRHVGYALAPAVVWRPLWSDRSWATTSLRPICVVHMAGCFYLLLWVITGKLVPLFVLRHLYLQSTRTVAPDLYLATGVYPISSVLVGFSLRNSDIQYATHIKPCIFSPILLKRIFFSAARLHGRVAADISKPTRGLIHQFLYSSDL